MQATQLLKLNGHRFRIASLALVALSLAFLFHTEILQAAPNTLARVRQTGSLKLGYFADVRPFSYQDETGQPAGYAISVCQEIAKHLKSELGMTNLAVDFVLLNVADRFEAVQQGKVDLLCGPTVETLARREEISYSIPIFPGGVGALLRADAPAQIRDVLAGHEPPYRPQWRASIGLALQKRTFSAVTGTTGLTWLTGKLNQFKIEAKIVPVDSFDEGVQKVLGRTSDVLFAERSALLDAKKRSPSGSDLIVIDRLFTYEPLGFALSRDDDEFRLAMDRSLSTLIRAGTIQSLYRDFFGEPDDDALTFFRMSAVPE